MSRFERPLDLGFVRSWFGRHGLAIWFAVVGLLRVSVLVTGEPAFDGRLYLRATSAWLHGLDPWISIGDQRFAAPPPTLLPLAPIAALPEDLGVIVLFMLGIAGAVATIRLLRLPWWWLLFPPLIDAVWNANPQALLIPLILLGAGPIATLLKVYAVAPIALTGRWRALLLSLALLLLTAPVLPWASYIDHAAELWAVLARQSDGGLSATAVPWLLPVAIIALVFCGRERAAWLAVPVLWPSTQWYYSTIAMPALTPIAAALMAVPIPGVVVLAAVAVALECRDSDAFRLMTRLWRFTGSPSRSPDRPS